MAALTIELVDREFRRLKAEASRSGRTVQAVIHELIDQLPEVEEDFDVTQDPLYDFSGYDLKVSKRLSRQVDETLYGGVQSA